jgi:hypothetical protein
VKSVKHRRSALFQPGRILTLTFRNSGNDSSTGNGTFLVFRRYSVHDVEPCAPPSEYCAHEFVARNKLIE